MKVCIVGIGKVGLAYAVFLASKGFEVTGVDINEKYIEDLKNGSYVPEEPGVKERLDTISYSTTIPNGCDYYIVLVDTPTCYAGYDHKNLIRVMKSIDGKGTTIVSCTTQPGFMNGYTWAWYSPLFIQLGNIITHESTTKETLVGGPRDEKIESFFKKIRGEDSTIHWMNHTAAEVAKLGLNCIITTKISFANMLGEALHRSGNSDQIHSVLDFIGSDPRVGTKCLKYGWGYGGPCFPRDNRALCTFLRRWGAADYIPVATHETNERHALTMAMYEPDADFSDLNYKENCAVRCEEESHKIKTLKVKNFIYE